MSLPNLVHKARAGFITLSLRSGATQILQLLSTLTLARYLDSIDYAVFGILNLLIGSLAFFNDIGIGEALLQKKEAATKEELQAFFGLRLILSSMIGFILFVTIPHLIAYYEFKSTDGIELLQFVCVLPILETITQIPKYFMHRNLDYSRLAKVEFSSNIIMYAVQISLAILGLAFWSFFIAMFVRLLCEIAGCLLIKSTFYAPSFKLSRLRQYLHFGFISQANLVIMTVNPLLFTFLLKKYLSTEDIGYYFWIMGLVSAPMTLMYNYNFVFFSALSRLQHSMDEMKHMAQRGMQNILLLLTLVFGLGGFACQELIPLLFHSKWIPAQQLLAVAAMLNLSFGLRFICYSLGQAMGKPFWRMASEIIALIVNLSILHFSVQNFQTAGAFLAQIAGNIAGTVVILLLISKYLDRATARRAYATLIGMMAAAMVIHYFGFSQQVLLAVPTYLLIFLSVGIILDPSILVDIKKGIQKVFPSQSNQA